MGMREIHEAPTNFHVESTARDASGAPVAYRSTLALTAPTHS